MRISFRQQRRLIIFFSTSLAAVFLLLIFQKASPVVGAMNTVRGVIAGAGTGVGQLVEHIFYSKAELIKTNDRLSSELEHLSLQAAKAAELEAENAALSALLNFSHRSELTPLLLIRVVPSLSYQVGNCSGATLLD